MTKVCVPTAADGGLDDLVGEHFGRVPTYTIYDSETDTVEIIDNTSEHAGGRGLPGEILSKLGIDVLLCSGLGRRAIGILTGNGIEVYVGVSRTAGEAVEAWKKGNLSKVSEGDACEKHAFHDRH
ncbi:NifB/NifX family molybdenum-iron cluster-binding protein [Candidatus Bipolaricaulota bacterium]|nr:NifB/NifX family molybdenum-iron cluster-binding protein [Candidatus Bipolaricaulota bacterium]